VLVLPGLEFVFFYVGKTDLKTGRRENKNEEKDAPDEE
jgi:hypothetical protein